MLGIYDVRAAELFILVTRALIVTKYVVWFLLGCLELQYYLPIYACQTTCTYA